MAVGGAGKRPPVRVFYDAPLKGAAQSTFPSHTALPGRVLRARGIHKKKQKPHRDQRRLGQTCPVRGNTGLWARQRARLFLGLPVSGQERAADPASLPLSCRWCLYGPQMAVRRTRPTLDVSQQGIRVRRYCHGLRHLPAAPGTCGEERRATAAKIIPERRRPSARARSAYDLGGRRRVRCHRPCCRRHRNPARQGAMYRTER